MSETSEAWLGPKWLVPLVGMQFRAGGKQIISVLGTGQDLALVRDAGNEYDSLAVMVGVEGAKLQPAAAQALERALSGTGLEPGEVLESPFWHLGFLAREGNKQFKGQAWNHGGEIARALDDGATLLARLQFSPEVWPIVEITRTTESKALVEALCDSPPAAPPVSQKDQGGRP